MKRKEAQHAAAEEEAMIITVEHKLSRIQDTRAKMIKERAIRTQQVIKLAKSYELHTTAEWSASLAAVDMKVKKTKRLNHAARSIQTMFRYRILKMGEIILNKFLERNLKLLSNLEEKRRYRPPM